MNTFFGGHNNCVISKKSVHGFVRKICREKSHKTFWASFGLIRAKIFRTPKHLPAPTPMFMMNVRDSTSSWRRFAIPGVYDNGRRNNVFRGGQ